MLAAGAFLFAIGFLASPAWPLDYFHSLTGFKDVSQCHQCVSPSMALAGLAGGGLDQAVWISAILAILAVVWWVRNWRKITADADRLVTAGILSTFLVSPYLQNYDYLLLLVPFLGAEPRGEGPGLDLDCSRICRAAAGPGVAGPRGQCLAGPLQR